VRYVSEKEETVFFINVMADMSHCGLVGGLGDCSGLEEPSRDRTPAQTPLKWQGRRVIPVRCSRAGIYNRHLSYGGVK